MTPPAGLRWWDLASPEDRHFPAFFAIYQESMPPREQKSRSVVAGLTARADYRIRLLLGTDGPDGVLGYSVTFAPADEDVRLLEYLAVRRDLRSRGLGGMLFQDAFAGLDVPGCRIHGLLEVDAPRPPAPDLAIRQARWQFYVRQGCRRLAGLDYHLPLPGDGPPPVMDLAVFGRGGESAIPRAQVAHWLRVIYRRVYGQQATDPRIAAMLAPLDDPVGLVSV